MLTLSQLTREYVRVAVDAGRTATGAAIDPTSLAVAMAFKASGLPADADWQPAVWSTQQGRYFAACLIGPGGAPALALAVGRYDVYLRLTDNPEVPVRRVDALQIV